MSTDSSQGIVDTIVAANDFRVVGALYKAVNEYGQFLAAGGIGAGIAYSQPNSGGHLNIRRQGIVKAWIGAAITSKGLVLAPAASGWLTLAASGALGIGKLLSGPVASGDLASVYVNFDRGNVVP